MNSCSVCDILQNLSNYRQEEIDSFQNFRLFNCKSGH